MPRLRISAEAASAVACSLIIPGALLLDQSRLTAVGYDHSAILDLVSKL